MSTDFEQELRALLNTHSVESESSTPDYILALYLMACLAAFANAMQSRDAWFGYRPFASTVTTLDEVKP